MKFHSLRKKAHTRVALFILCGFVTLTIFFKSLVHDNPVFSFSASEKSAVSWEEYLSDREKRNEKAMKRSYAELMKEGNDLMKKNKWNLARQRFYFAKTIFPDKIAPRKNLCYSYFMMCQEDWRACDMGKRELYYAMKYVQPTDKISYEYLYHLVELVQMEEIVEMDEGAALAAIF